MIKNNFFRTEIKIGIMVSVVSFISIVSIWSKFYTSIHKYVI